MTGKSIEELLHRRSDLSTYLVHLTRADPRSSGAQGARERLLSILRAKRIEARTSLGVATDEQQAALQDTAATQRVVCFTETPLEHTWMMVQDIEGRQNQFQPYGVVFTKSTCRRHGCNPVWYTNNTAGTTWIASHALNALVHAAGHRAKAEAADPSKIPELLAQDPIFDITPFIEQMGTWPGSSKEIWWEREWRHRGDFRFFTEEVVSVLAPQGDHPGIRREITELDDDWAEREVPILDPEWGLERMIASLAGVAKRDLGPFPS